METDRLMQAVLQSFFDADLRVEVLPRSDKPSTQHAGTGPSRDATTQAADGRYNMYTYPRAESRQTANTSAAAAREQADRTTQAVDGRYATVYKVHHCKMVPTSPPAAASEFPPQRTDVAYGADNFQVGGMGSGETSGAPVKTSCYRGGLNWTSRGAVYAPRPSHCCDSFASSLRKYPAVSPERSAEVLERLVSYSMPKAYRSPRYSPHRSPQREGISYRSPRSYEETYAATCKPRAPEDCPTKDRRENIRKLASAKHGDIRFIREVSRRLRKSLKSIPTYPPTQTLPSVFNGRNQEWGDTPIPETSETDHEDREPTPSVREDERSWSSTRENHPVNTTVQAVAPTSSLGLETKLLPSQRSVAVPLSPSPSSRLSTRANPVVTRSVQTFEAPGRSIEALTSTTELVKHDPVKVVAKKSRSLSDFRLNRDFKDEILAWLDDTSDPKIKEIQEVVLKNLNNRLKGVSTKGAKKIKVKIGNCLKCCHTIQSKHSSNCVSNTKRIINSNTQSQEVFSVEIDPRFEAEQNDFEDIIKNWLSDISIKKRDILLRPVERKQIYNTFVNRLKHLICEKSKYSAEQEQALREEILEILGEVPIEVDACDKSVYLNRVTDTLCRKLQNIPQSQIKSEPCNHRIPDKLNTYLPRHHSQNVAKIKKTEDIVVNTMVEHLQKQNVVNPDVIKQTIVDLVDMLMDSVNTNIGLEKIASAVHGATRLSKEEALEFAAQLTENCKDLNDKKYANTARSQPLAVFMVQNLSRNYVTKTSGTNMSRHSIRSIIDKDIEANLNKYKMQLAQKIDQWLSDLEILRANDTDFRQAVVLDLASDIVDRQKYLEFNKTRGTDLDELEHLKYQIFKWMKRYVGEDNLETVDHAAELMQMIKNIPVPIMNSSQIHLFKSNSGTYFKDEPGTSTESSNNVFASLSDSGICNREESQSGLEKQRKQTIKTSATTNRWKSVANLSNTSVQNDSDLSRRSFKNQRNSNETSNNKCSNSKRTNPESNDTEKVGNGQDTRTSGRYRDEIYKSTSEISCRDNNLEPSTSISNNQVIKSKSNPGTCNQEETQNYSILTNYMVHKIPTNNTNELRKQKGQTPSTSRRRNVVVTVDSDISKRSSKKKKNSGGKPQHKLNSSSTSDSKLQEALSVPGPSGLVTPVPTHAGKLSAAAQLIAEWRPPPVFTPPPPGQPLINQVHEDFQEYLKNWCQQIPIPANTPEEIKIAEKARLGILNGIWKIITKIKAQPAVFQNRFYYEDVLGKEIDELLNCLPQTQELTDRRYALKAQLLEKNSDMNELIKELEVPDNYKEIIAENKQKLKDEKIRRVVKTNEENPTKIFEEMLMYCTLDDFLEASNYIENDVILAKAYKSKLLKKIQEYMNELKKSHRGKEMEDLLDVWRECDIFEVLYKVPLPTEESIRENTDEIILGLEIEQWMNDLPLVHNDDGNEQRQRKRLRDALTHKLHEMEKRGNIDECCGNTQVRHEISFFLDKVPLEKDQDLKINEMVEELTNRLKNRPGANERRKAVVFQDGRQNQSGNQSSRLLNRSQLANATAGPGPDRLYTTNNEWARQEDENIQYRDMLQNAPLCSTQLEQTGDEWAMEAGRDAQYSALFKDIPACSSMIEPQADYEPRDNLPILPDYHQPYNQDPYFAYTPGQFHESAREGAFGNPLHSSLPHSDEKYRYPDLIEPPIMPRDGPPLPRFFDSQGNIIPNVSLPVDQYQPVRGPHSFISAKDASLASPMMRQVAFDPPPAVNWTRQNDGSGFVSMVDGGPPRSPLMHMSEQRHSNGRPAYTPHRSQIEPNVSQRAADSFHSPLQNEQPMVEPARFMPDASRFSRSPNASRSIRVDVQPNPIRQEPVEVSVHDDRRFSRRSPRADGSRQPQGPDMLPVEPARSGFLSLASHQQQEVPPAAYLEASARNQSIREANQPSIRVTPTTPVSRPEFRRSTDREGIQEIINQNRSANRSVREQSQIPSGRPIRDPLSRQVSTQNPAPTDRLAGEAVSGAPSPPRRSDRGFTASNALSSEISNQPAFYSTPDQRDNLPPPNMRERRQIEKERAPARRINMDTEDADDGEERCHCRERFKRWKDSRQAPNCSTCEECVHGHRGFYPYPYPYPYPYLSYGRPPPPPPYPPNCRR